MVKWFLHVLLKIKFIWTSDFCKLKEIGFGITTLVKIIDDEFDMIPV